MKKIKGIKKLDAMREKVIFPELDETFEQFKNMMHQVILDNLPVDPEYSPTRPFMEYEPYSQLFWYTAYIPMMLPKDVATSRSVGSFSVAYTIDPTEPLESQIKDIQKEIESIKKWASANTDECMTVEHGEDGTVTYRWDNDI